MTDRRLAAEVLVEAFAGGFIINAVEGAEQVDALMDGADLVALVRGEDGQVEVRGLVDAETGWHSDTGKGWSSGRFSDPRPSGAEGYGRHYRLSPPAATEEGGP